MRRLSGLDAQFFAAEGGNACSHYCALAIYDTPGPTKPITAATMRDLLDQRIHLLPPLRWKPVMVPLGLDRPVFVDTDVNLSDHISEISLKAPATETSLAAELEALLAQRLDRDKPLWRLRVFHGIPGRTAVVITLHHGAVDGLGAKEIFDTLLDISGEHSELDSAANAPAGSAPTRASLALRGLLAMPLRPASSIRASRAIAHLDQVPVLRSLPGVHTVARIIRRDIEAQRVDAPRTRFNTKLSGTRSVAFGTVSLNDVKAIKDQSRVTVNDVVITLCAGALRRWLLARQELPPEPLVAYVPISTRISGRHGQFGNAISSIIATIPTHLASAADRLAFTHETLLAGKRRASKTPPTLLQDVNEQIPAPMFGLVARGLMDLISSSLVRPPVNLIISNVPGSPVALECAGAPLLAHYPLSLIFDGFALNMTVVSYQDGLDVGIVGDAKALPDAWELMADFRAELAELSLLVTQGSAEG
jgi:diacylglycerol O-acyltransferase / wax synthase